MLLKCFICGDEFKRSPSQVKRSKSGHSFCSRSCGVTFTNKQKKGENHPNYKHGLDVGTKYRKKAIDFYGAVCICCGYDKEPVLEVHHIDKRSENNNIENLAVVCPNCHTEIHLGLRTLGRFDSYHSDS